MRLSTPCEYIHEINCAFNLQLMNSLNTFTTQYPTVHYIHERHMPETETPTEIIRHQATDYHTNPNKLPVFCGSFYMTFYCLFLLLMSGTFNINAQSELPKREFRAAWVATIGNIDWPSKQGLDAETQKAEFKSLLLQCKKNGLNALIVQIRPVADALYDSPFENWSRYLSGKQGVPPSPYYDPLHFMVEEAHKQCIEFHAWFNPYRALVDATKNPHTKEHITWQHPEWFVNYGGKRYFDPGLPEVRAYFTAVVLDVVKRYDIDAVHFDDYFYPYRIAHVEFPDQKSYSKYHGEFISKDDWRRNNVNVLIENLSKKIKETKAHVKFGISPFGVWRNHTIEPDGSHTNGGQTN